MQVSRRALLQFIAGTAAMTVLPARSREITELVDVEWLDSLRVTMVTNSVDADILTRLPLRSRGGDRDMLNTLTDRPALADLSIRANRIEQAGGTLPDRAVIIQVPGRVTLVSADATITEKKGLGTRDPATIMAQQANSPYTFIVSPLVTIVGPQGRFILSSAEKHQP